MAKSRFSAHGPSQRQLRVGEVLRRAISEVLAKGDLHDPDLANASITVGEVRTTPDLKMAMVHVMPLGGANVDTIILALNRNKSDIRKAVNKTITLKYSPDLKFLRDTTFEQMDETRRLLNQDAVRKDITD